MGQLVRHREDPGTDTTFKRVPDVPPLVRVLFVICAEGVHLYHFTVFSESTVQRKQMVSKSPN